MSPLDQSLGSKIAGLALEAAMVVFAVLVALGVEEWRDDRQMQDFADRARAAVLAEVTANLAELRQTGPGLDSTLATLDAVVRGGDVTLLGDDLSMSLPDFSSAVASEIIAATGTLIGGDLTVANIRTIYGHLAILTDVHGQVEERLEALLVNEGA